MVRGADGQSVVLGAGGSRNLATGEVIGDDPLEPFGPFAVRQVTMVDGYSTVADVMVNSAYDPVNDEVAAFEEQVGSHGGLGGPQTHPFLLYPPTWPTRRTRSSAPRPSTRCSRAGCATSANPSASATRPSDPSVRVAPLTDCASFTAAT